MRKKNENALMDGGEGCMSESVSKREQSTREGWRRLTHERHAACKILCSSVPHLENFLKTRILFQTCTVPKNTSNRDINQPQ